MQLVGRPSARESHTRAKKTAPSKLDNNFLSTEFRKLFPLFRITMVASLPQSVLLE